MIKNFKYDNISRWNMTGPRLKPTHFQLYKARIREQICSAKSKTAFNNENTGMKTEERTKLLTTAASGRENKQFLKYNFLVDPAVISLL